MGSCGCSRTSAPPFCSLTDSSTMAIHVNPSQFVIQQEGNFIDHYKITKKLGGGTTFLPLIPGILIRGI